MSPSSRVAVVLVNWNSAQDVVRVVTAIQREYPETSVIVVDNASEVEDFNRLANLAHSGVVIERLAENRGYAAGVNCGLTLAQQRGHKWAWLMNPDALPFEGCLDALLEVAEGCGVLSPRQLSSSQPLDEAATQYVSAARAVGSRYEHEACPGCAVGYHDVDVVTGTGLLVDVGVAHAIGLMNEDFFHYKEEFEFAERAAEVSRVRYVCGARLWHERGGSLSQASAQADYYRVRNELLYLAMRLDRPWRARARTWRWLLRATGEAVRANPASRRAILRGMHHGLTGRSGRSDG